MKKKFLKTITKTLTAVALAAVISTPAFVAQTSSVATVETNKNSWVASMHNTKVTRVQQTSVKLLSGVGKKNSVNLVKVGVYRNGKWNCVIEPSDGVRMIKNDYLQTFNLNRSVSIGEAMRIRLKLSNENANSGFAKDTVAHVWYWN